MLTSRLLPPRLYRALALCGVMGAALVTGACDDGGTPEAPRDSGGLAPVGTGEGTDVGEVDEPVDGDVTGEPVPTG